VTVLERIPLEAIDERARAADPGRAAATVIAAVLFGTGWLAARALSLAWISLAWSVSAVAEGWAAGRSAQWARHVEKRRAASAGRPG
jgi:hypothetical protein